MSTPIMTSGLSFTPLRQISSGTFFVDEDHVDMQPLDLRVRPSKQDQGSINNHVEDHKPRCFDTCTRNIEDTRAHHRMSKSGTNSPKPGILTSLLSRTDSPISTKHPTSSHEIYSNNISSVITRPLLSSTISLQAPSLRLPTKSSIFQKTNPLDSFTSYYECSNSYKQIHNYQPLTAQQNVNHDESENEPTYMDLDLATVNLPGAKFTGDSSPIYSEKNISKNISIQPRKIEGKINPKSYPPKVRNKNGRGFFELERETICYEDEEFQTYRKKSQKKTPYSTARPPNSQHQQNRKQQMCSPDSSTSPDRSRASPLDSKLTSSHSSVLNLQLPKSLFLISSSVESSTFPSSSENDNNSSSPAARSLMYQPCTKKLSNTEKNTTFKQTMNRTPSSTTTRIPTSTFTKEIVGENHNINIYNSRINCVNSSSHEIEEDEKSMQVSVLDFWITKVLLERSVDVPTSGRPCNVDYICTENGEKRIRLRLVDLIELQVEQSLKA